MTEDQNEAINYPRYRQEIGHSWAESSYFAQSLYQFRLNSGIHKNVISNKMVGDQVIYDLMERDLFIPFATHMETWPQTLGISKASISEWTEWTGQQSSVEISSLLRASMQKHRVAAQDPDYWGPQSSVLNRVMYGVKRRIFEIMQEWRQGNHH